MLAARGLRWYHFVVPVIDFRKMNNQPCQYRSQSGPARDRMVGYSALFVIAYLLATGAIMYANTAWLGLGDRKLGTEGWRFYWGLWSFFFSPVCIGAMAAAWLAGRQSRVFLLAWFFVITMIAMDLSFLMDISLPGLQVEMGGLIAGYLLIAGLCRGFSNENCKTH